MGRKQSAMGSSKYEFEPDKFNEDVENKRQVAKQFKEDLENVLYNSYFYHDGSYMNDKTKRAILIEVHLEFVEMLEG